VQRRRCPADVHDAVRAEALPPERGIDGVHGAVQPPGRSEHLAAEAVGDHHVVAQDRYSPTPEGLFRVAQIDRPTIGKGEVLVRVHAASVDRGTWHIMAGLPFPIRLAGFGLRRPKYANPGRNLAGTVEAVGADVTGFAPGDKVFGTSTGTFAEYAAARTDKLAPKPANLSFDQAAAVPSSGAPPCRPSATTGASRPVRRS
jgi:NADPH-dependent curcumin reductase CurA